MAVTVRRRENPPRWPTDMSVISILHIPYGVCVFRRIKGARMIVAKRRMVNRGNIRLSVRLVDRSTAPQASIAAV